MTEENYEARAQAHLASLKRDMKASMEDAVVRAMHKVMAEFEAKSDERLMEDWGPGPHEHHSLPARGTEQKPVALPEKIYEFVPTPEPAKWHHPECEGECIACLIERVVQEAYGSQGLSYLQRHLTSSPAQQEPVGMTLDASAPLVMVPHPAFQQPQMQPCAGRNCGSTNPNLHSAECFEDYEKSTGLEPAQQEPVAWYRDEDGIRIYYESKVWDDATPLYTSPPAQQEPAGSVYRYGKDSSGKQWHGIRWTASGLDLPDGTLIYTSPQRKPLTDEMIQECWYRTQGDAELFARAIEAAHNIKERP